MSKRRLGIGVAAMVVVGVVVYVYWSHGPSVSKISKIDQSVKGAQSPDYTTKLFQNDYLSVQIPKRYQTKTTNFGTGKPLFVQQLLASQSTGGAAGFYSDQLALTVGKLPTGGLKELSDIQLRRRTSDYTALQYDWLGTNALVYENALSGYEIGLFIAGSNRYVTLVLSGTADKKEQLQHELQTLYVTLIWR